MGATVVETLHQVPRRWVIQADQEICPLSGRQQYLFQFDRVLQESPIRGDQVEAFRRFKGQEKKAGVAGVDDA